MLLSLASFVWPIIGGVALLLFLLWICYTVKRNAITNFFEPEESTNRPRISPIELNVIETNEEEIAVRPPTRRGTRLGRTRRLRELAFIVFSLLISFVENAIYCRKGVMVIPYQCACPALNNNETFLITNSEQFVNYSQWLTKCTCWGNDWRCYDAELIDGGKITYTDQTPLTTTVPPTTTVSTITTSVRAQPVPATQPVTVTTAMDMHNSDAWVYIYLVLGVTALFIFISIVTYVERCLFA